MMINLRNSVLWSFSSVLLVAVTVCAQEPAPAPSPVPSRPNSEMRRAREWRRFEYTCGGGEKVTVFLNDQTIKVRFKDQTYLMKQVESANGAKYSDGKVLWWNVGNGGFLQEDTPDGNGAMLAKDCKQDKPMEPGAAANTVTGTVSYLARIALPPTSVIQIQLLDVSLADAPAKVLAEEKITLGERQVPVSFSLTFDPAKIEHNHAYSISARILVDGQLRFISDKTYPVITRGNPQKAELILKPVPATAPAKP